MTDPAVGFPGTGMLDFYERTYVVCFAPPTHNNTSSQPALGPPLDIKATKKEESQQQ